MKKSRERNAHANDATSARATFRREDKEDVEEEEEDIAPLLPPSMSMTCVVVCVTLRHFALVSNEEKITSKESSFSPENTKAHFKKEKKIYTKYATTTTIARNADNERQ